MPGTPGQRLRARLRGQLPGQPHPDRIETALQRPRIRHPPQQRLGGQPGDPVRAHTRQLREQLEKRRAGGFHVESFSSTTDIPDIPNIAPDQLFITRREGSLWRRGTSKDVLKTTRDKEGGVTIPTLTGDLAA